MSIRTPRLSVRLDIVVAKWGHTKRKLKKSRKRFKRSNYVENIVLPKKGKKDDSLHSVQRYFDTFILILFPHFGVSAIYNANIKFRTYISVLTKKVGFKGFTVHVIEPIFIF